MMAATMRAAVSTIIAAWTLVCLATAFPVSAEGYGSQLRISGEIRQDLAISLEGGDVIANATSYRLSIRHGLAAGPAWPVPGGLYVSLRGEYDLEAGAGRPACLDEAYLDLYLDDTDVRLGQQLVNWGSAYGLNPTSYVNPRPTISTATASTARASTATASIATASLASASPGPIRLLEAARLPVPALSVTYYPWWGDVSVVAVFDPRLQGVPLPAEAQSEIVREVASQVALGLPAPGIPVVVSGDRFLADAPASLADRLELAARAGTRLGAWDLYLGAFRGWEDEPALWVTTEQRHDPALGPVVDVAPGARYRKVTEVGASATCAWGPYTFWVEGSQAWPDALAELDDPANTPLSSNRPRARLVAGGDRHLGGAAAWYLMAQYVFYSSGSILSPYSSGARGGEPGRSGAGRSYIIAMARCAPSDDHQFEIAGIYSLNDGGLAALPRYTYRPAPGISLWVGLPVARGAAGTEIGGLADRAGPMLVAGAKALF